MGIFSNCQISLDLDVTQVPFKKKQLLRKLVTSNGGVISYILTKKTTYLVASNGPKTADSYKGRTALKQGVPIVSVSFIERSAGEGKLLDHDDFLLVGKTTSMQFSSGKITSTKTQQEPKKKIKVSSFNINKFKVWPWGSVDAPTYPEDKYEVAKSGVLEKTNIRSKDRIFVHLELHAVPDDVFDLARSSEDSERGVEFPFRVFTHRGVLDNVMDENGGTREVRYCSTSEDALELYSFLYQQQHNMSRCKRLPSRWIGSPKYRQTQLSIGEHEEDEMSKDVASLVGCMWKETLGELEDILDVDVKMLTVEKVSKAESILLQIRKALDSRSGDAEDDDRETSIADLSQEFYGEIPHKSKHKKDIRTKSLIAKKQDLCQLIKDVVSVSETTNWSQRSSVESKYRALRCHISCLPQNHPQYYDVKNLIVSTQGKKQVEILRVFAVTRPLELTSFDAKLHNSHLLFHASRPANFVGILSRGLVLPKVVVDDFGGKRTDAGMLGSGIYFADNFSTSAKYSHASQTRGSRLMAVNQVALGECYQTTGYKKELTKPPGGFQSVHGVKNNGTNHSDFKDDEYAVYSAAQQRIRYVVEFTLPGDQPALTTSPVIDSEGAVHSDKDGEGEASDDNANKMDAIDLSDVQSIDDPLSKIQPGLLSNNDKPIPLKAVHVRARLLDLAAQVVVLQVYANDSKSPIEAKYVFPLDEQAAVCGFEAFINDKHIVGEVKEKETAHKEYKEAVSRGHGAYLMDEEKPDVFTVSVGNLPPKTTVVIKITYVAELSVDGDKILFALPGSVAPWRKDAALAQKTQTDVATVRVNKDTKRSLSVHISVEMPYDIRSLESPTHSIKRKQTASKATVCLAEDCLGLDDGFQLLIGLAEIHVPRMWVEKHPKDADSQACMLTFYPEFEAKKNDQSEVVVLLDLSNSMRGGSALQEAKKVALLALHHLPNDWKFNIVVFGTDFEELFPKSQIKTSDAMKSARNFLQGLSATMGNTDVWRPLLAYFMLKSGALRNVFFISDGHVSNEDATLDAVRRNCCHTRVFTFGISPTANKYLLRALSTAGAGAFEFFDSKTKSKWEGKIQTQLGKASQPVLSAVRVDWCQFDDNAPEPVQAPNRITSLFSGSRQVVYGFVPHCTQATLRANNDGREVSTMVSTHELSITEGKILHQLTARNIIRDWEEGALAADRTQHEARKAERKSYIIGLSKEYSIVTQFTSFVAVEVRDKAEEGKPKAGVDVAELLMKEEVDALPYLGWLEDKEPDDASVRVNSTKEWSALADLMDKAEMESSFSVLRAERLYEKIMDSLKTLGFPSKADRQLLQRTGMALRDFYGNVKHDENTLGRVTVLVNEAHSPIFMSLKTGFDDETSDESDEDSADDLSEDSYVLSDKSDEYASYMYSESLQTTVSGKSPTPSTPANSARASISSIPVKDFESHDLSFHEYFDCNVPSPDAQSLGFANSGFLRSTSPSQAAVSGKSLEPFLGRFGKELARIRYTQHSRRTSSIEPGPPKDSPPSPETGLSSERKEAGIPPSPPPPTGIRPPTPRSTQVKVAPKLKKKVASPKGAMVCLPPSVLSSQAISVSKAKPLSRSVPPQQLHQQQQQQQLVAQGISFGGDQEQPLVGSEMRFGGIQLQPTTASGFGFGGIKQQPPEETGMSFRGVQQQYTMASGFGFGGVQQQPTTSSGFGFEGAQQQPTTASGFGFGGVQQQPTTSSGFGFRGGQQQPPEETGVSFGDVQQRSIMASGISFGGIQQPPIFGSFQESATEIPFGLGAASSFGQMMPMAFQASGPFAGPPPPRPSFGAAPPPLLKFDSKGTRAGAGAAPPIPSHPPSHPPSRPPPPPGAGPPPSPCVDIPSPSRLLSLSRPPPRPGAKLSPPPCADIPHAPCSDIPPRPPRDRIAHQQRPLPTQGPPSSLFLQAGQVRQVKGEPEKLRYNRRSCCASQEIPLNLKLVCGSPTDVKQRRLESGEEEGATSAESGEADTRQELLSASRDERLLKEEADRKVEKPQSFDASISDRKEFKMALGVRDSLKVGTEANVKPHRQIDGMASKLPRVVSIDEEEEEDEKKADKAQTSRKALGIPHLEKASIQLSKAMKCPALFDSSAMGGVRRSSVMKKKEYIPRSREAELPSVDIASDLLDEVEISTAISAPMSFAASESKFRVHNGDFSLLGIQLMQRNQNVDGSWGLLRAIKVYVGIRLKPVKNMLEAAGVNSLGEEVAVQIEKLVATYLVILYVNHFLAQAPAMWGWMREGIAQSVLKAERFICLVETEQPSLARRLELGGSWDEVCRDIFKMM